MRIKYTIVCLIALIGSANAQYQNYVLKDPDPNTDSHSYIGRDYVRLTNGYKFTAVSGKTMNAKVNSGLSTADANTFVAVAIPNGGSSDAVTAIDKTLAVGQIPISSTVSPSGAKCYNVPIEIVPGRMGFQPNISLSYNSQTGNGVVGMGWNISGLSSIERVNKNMFIDGKTEAITISNDGAFVLDGARIIETSRTTEQINYETVLGNTKIIAYLTQIGLTGTKFISYFKVLYPNGVVGIFGNENNSRDYAKLTFPISKLTDMNSNELSFSYTFDGVNLNNSPINYQSPNNVAYYIDEINYGKCKDKADFAKIKFTYETRIDQIFSLQSSKSCVYRKRLNKIESFANSNLIRSYQLVYSNIDTRITSNQNDVSRLTQISSFVNDGSSTVDNLNPLKFYYGEAGTANLTVVKQPVILPSFHVDLSKINVVRGKFDTNIQNDALIVYAKGNVYDSGTHSESYLVYPADSVINIYQNLNTTPTSAQPIKAEFGLLDIKSANIDGVGTDEIVKINSSGISGNQGDVETVTFKIYKPNSSGLYLDRTESLNFDSYNCSTYDFEGYTYNSYSIEPKKFYTGDFTGKGITEILIVPLFSQISVLNLNVESPTVKKHIYSGSISLDYNSGLIYPMDIDGDGQTEIVYVTDANTILYKYKDGSGFLPIGNWTLKKPDFDNRQILFSDINGDGKTDIIMSPKAPVSWIYPEVYVGDCIKCPFCTALNPITTPNGPTPYPGANCVKCGKLIYGSLLHPNWSLGAHYIDPNDPFLGMHTHKVCVICNRDIPWDGTCPVHKKIFKNFLCTDPNTYDKKWKYLYSDGLNTPFIVEKDFINREYTHQYSIQDIDGDNTPELIVNINGNIQIYPYRDNDHSFDTNSIASFNIGSTSEIIGFELNSVTIDYDVNSDKCFSQLIAINKTGLDKFTFSQNRAKNNQLSLMINSLGIAEKTNYDQLYQGANYTPGTAAAFPNTDFQGPLWVATQNSAMYNKQLISNTTYNYTGAILHKQGLGLRGFTSMKATDLMTNKETTTGFNPYQMGAITHQTSDKEEATFVYNFTDYSNLIGGNKKMKLLLNNKTVTDKLNGNTATVTYSGYDDYGNVGTEVTNFSGDITNKLTVVNTYNNDVTSTIYMLGMLTNRKTTTQRGSTTFIQNEGYEYFDETGKNRLQFIRKSIYKDALTKMPVSYTEYKYNADYGTLREETVHNSITNNSADDLTTLYTYWPDDQCSLLEKTDPFGLKTTYNYKFTTRILDYVTDYKGNTIKYGYDSWRRKTSEVSTVGADVITTALDLKWNTESEPKRLIQLTTTTTGQPTSTQYADAFGRETRKAVSGFDGTAVYADKEYGNLGQLLSSSAPYKTTPLWTTYGYDEFDRPISVIQPNGSTTSYTYDGNKISENKDGISTSKTTDATGKLVNSTDNGGTVTYTYRADGQPDKVNAALVETGFKYDDYGRQTKLIDPSAGTVQTAYDDAKHTVTQTWNSGKVITTVTNKFGQPVKKTTPDFITDYTYENGQPKSVTSNNGTSKSLDYDTFGRLWKINETVNGKTYQEVYGYDNGRIGSVTYNTNTGTNTLSYPVIYKYNGNGYLYRLEDASGNRLREVNSVNALGQESNVLLGNGLTTTKSYTPEGLWTNVTTSNSSNRIQDMSFDFNRINGTLNSRTDNVHNLSESFTYDNRVYID